MADEYSRDATLVVEIIKEMTDIGRKTQLIQAYSDSLRAIWLSILAFSAVGLVLSATVKGYSMKQEHVTKQKLVQREKGSENATEAAVMDNDM